MRCAVIDRLAAGNDAADASALWRLLIEKRWVVADSTVPNNAGFQRDPLPVSFDWSIPEYEGLHSWPGSSGLETEFSGRQPEDCTIADQEIVLAPGKYALDFAYHTTDIPPDTGIHWQMIDPKSNLVLAESTALSSEEVKHTSMGFLVPPGVSLVRLRLAYRRTLGTTRIAGMLDMDSVQIEKLPR